MEGGNALRIAGVSYFRECNVATGRRICAITCRRSLVQSPRVLLLKGRAREDQISRFGRRWQGRMAIPRWDEVDDAPPRLWRGGRWRCAAERLRASPAKRPAIPAASR